MKDVKCIRCDVPMNEIRVSSRSCTTTNFVQQLFQSPTYTDKYWMHLSLVAHSPENDPSNRHVPIEEYETVQARQCPKCGTIELFTDKIV